MASGKRPEDMTREEQLESMREFAEEQKHVRPGEDGTIPSDARTMQALVFGGPMMNGPEYDKPLAPPSYETATGEHQASHKEKEPGPIKKWFKEHHHEKKEANDKEGKVVR